MNDYNNKNSYDFVKSGNDRNDYHNGYHSNPNSDYNGNNNGDYNGYYNSDNNGDYNGYYNSDNNGDYNSYYNSNHNGDNNSNRNENYNNRHSGNENSSRKAYRSGMITGALMGIAIMLILLLGFNVVIKRIYNNNSGNIVENVNSISEKIETIEKYLDKYYYEDIDEEELANGIYYGMTASLGDPYTTYYTPKEYKDLTTSNNGEYCGIGVVVRQDATGSDIVVNRVFTDSPAMEAGLQVGDIFYSVNDEEIVDMTTEELAAMIIGEEGTPVDIQIKRDDEILDFTIVRKKVQMDTVTYEMKEGNIGYIKIEEFDGVTASQVAEAIEQLNEQEMKGIIIDLRDNPGGRLDSVRDIASMFLEGKRLFLYSETKDGDREDYNTNGRTLLEDLPMVVLINGQSASASEAFSGAMKSYGRAELVGTTSFGKGIMQSIYPLKDGSALKITIGKYYLPDGSNIHKTGITPDYEVEASENPDEDTQLDKAIELLK